MDGASTSSSVTPGREPDVDTVDWRTQLSDELRQRIIVKIFDTLKRHLPFSGEDGLYELRRMAEWFEGKVYAIADSQSDYLRRICLKMLTVESAKQNRNKPVCIAAKRKRVMAPPPT